MSRANRTDHIRLTSHPEPGRTGRIPDPLGRRRRTRPRADHRHGVARRGSQRDRQPWRLLRDVPRARGVRRRARSDPSARPHQHLSGRDHRAVSAMERSRQDRRARSLGASRRREFRQGHRRGHRHQAEHRGDARAAGPAGDPRGARRQAPARRRRRRARQWQRVGGEDRDRSGLVSARPCRALCDQRDRAAAHAVRADRRHVPRAGDPAGHEGVSATDRRHHGVHVRRRDKTAGPSHQDHLPRA